MSWISSNSRYILDRYHRLVGECGHQFDLLLGERTHGHSRQIEHAIGTPSRISGTPSMVPGVFRIGADVGNMNSSPLKRRGALNNFQILLNLLSNACKFIDALFAIEREINGMTPQQRLAVRNERSRPLIAELETWLRTQRASSLERARQPRQSTTASNVGWRSLASSPMGAGLA